MNNSSLAPFQATLIYDGDCAICARWVAYWSELTGAQVRFRPYQDAAADYPDIPLDAFRRAIQFVAADGRIYAGAAATFQVLRHAPGRRAWWWLYRHAPGFAPASERAYAFFARRRGLLSHLTQFLWGIPLAAERYDLVRWLFLRGLGLVYFAAFASLAAQINGLVGSAGILPLAAYLREMHELAGAAAYAQVPTLFWLTTDDNALVAGTVLGMVLAALVVLGIGVRAALLGLFVLYLSYVHAGQVFLMFQWDVLLLEAGFLAIFLDGGSRIVVWLYRWLAFRFMFMAGAAKLASGDATWRDLSALQYHFWTQPLPTPLAWHVAQWPEWMLSAGTAAVLLVEVGIVFLIFAPRRLRAAAAWSVLSLESVILLTGNYNFFNLLTMLLFVFLFDDAALRRVFPARLAERIAARTPHPGRAATTIAAVIALLVVPAGAHRVAQLVAGTGIPVAGAINDALSALLIANHYGLFAVMTTARPEIVIEGSADGQAWREYEFRYKPGVTSRGPSWNIPHQPRLDWEMWFAALGGNWEEPWFGNFLRRLLQNSAPVVSLLAVNPFPDHPPRFVRATLYDYRFADPVTHAATGAWWVRRRDGDFSPVLRLPDSERSRVEP